jgi:hypothetical protein
VWGDQGGKVGQGGPAVQPVGSNGRRPPPSAPGWFAWSAAADDMSKTFTRFKGEILDKGNQASIKGMTGGPLFGFYKEGGDLKYLLEALQVAWDKATIVYGCTIKTIMTALQIRLQQHQQSRLGNAAGT